MDKAFASYAADSEFESQVGCIFLMRVVRPFCFLLLFSIFIIFISSWTTKLRIDKVILSSCTNPDFDGFYVLYYSFLLNNENKANW